MNFEWDEAKAASNVKKHGVDFIAASQVFLDPLRLERRDSRFDYGEDRFQTVGEVTGRVIFIVYTERGARIRLISARKATSAERRAYEQARR